MKLTVEQYETARELLYNWPASAGKKPSHTCRMRQVYELDNSEIVSPDYADDEIGLGFNKAQIFVYPSGDWEV